MNFKLALKGACVSAWENFKNNLGAIIGAMLICLFSFFSIGLMGILIIIALAGGLSMIHVALPLVLVPVFGLFIAYIVSVMALGWNKFVLDIHDRNELKYSRLFSFIKLGFRPWLAWFITLAGIAVISFLGCAAYKDIIIELFQAVKANPSAIYAVEKSKFIGMGIFVGIPALVWFYYFMIRFTWVNLLIVDQNASSIEAVNSSYKLTRGIFWKLFALQLVYNFFSQVLHMIPVIGQIISWLLFAYMSLVYTALYRSVTNVQQELVN